MSRDIKYYMVLDGRAIAGSDDDASVVECVGEMSRKQAIKYFNKEWSDHGNCLYEYDIDGGNLSGGVLVYHDTPELLEKS